MVTYARLRVADPQRWTIAAGAYRSAGAAVADRITRIDAIIVALRDVWFGLGGGAALARLAAIRSTLTAAQPALLDVDQALSEFAETIRLAQDALTVASSPVTGSIVRVSPDGTAFLSPESAPPDAGDHADLASVEDAIAGALRIACEADEDTARRLSSVFDGFRDIVLDVPREGADPAAVASWWARLDAAGQRFLIAERPAAISGLDGVPVDARDRAARVSLREWREELVTRRALLAAEPVSRSVRVELDDLDARLAGLDRLATRLDDPNGTRAYLLGLDVDANRAIVAIGDPDRTRDVLTFVPGLGCGLAGIASSLAAIDGIAAAAPRDFAVIGWLDYGAPATLGQAMGTRAADLAVDDLSRFDTGLRVTHIGPPAHESLLGYSYGSTVAGITVRDRMLTDNDLIFVASPGVGVDHANDLRIDPDHVWSTRARYDAIRAAADPIARLRDTFTLGAPGAMWFGADPAGNRFGGHVFASDPGDWRDPIATHQAYFRPGATSLAVIARIATSDGRE